MHKTYCLARLESIGPDPPEPFMSTLQTLDRGLRALSIVAQASVGITVADLAAALGVDRAICYRIVATLEGHGMVARGARGRLHLGAGVLALEGRFIPHFATRVTPELDRLAQATGASAFLSVAQGAESVAVAVSLPEGRELQVAYRIGSRHPLTRGAAGIAILSARAPAPEDLASVTEARKAGFSLTRGELQKGAVGLAVPLRLPRGIEACVGVVAMEDLAVAPAQAAVTACAEALQSAMAP
jgi:DNA-binding IclR family transcriptional regulator